MRAAAARPERLSSAAALALLLASAGAAVAAGEPVAPNCDALLALVQKDPSSIRDGAPLLSVSAIVEDQRSTNEVRICTGVALYRDGEEPVTYTAHWRPAKGAFDIELHQATEDEAASRARSLRALYHPAGEDGTFALTSSIVGCTEPDYRELAARELQLGISVQGSFYREPDFDIFDIAANGFGSGLLSNCIATVGSAKARGRIFLGTDWTGDESDRRVQFYVLDAGPDGFKLRNRLWELNGK